MRRIAITVALLSAACGDNLKATPQDAGTNVQPLAPCLDRPTDLARPPSGQLPCELLPPGFAP